VVSRQGPQNRDQRMENMGWRHRKARTPESKEIWTTALLTQGKKAGSRTEPSASRQTPPEPALPALAVLRLSYRQLGYFRRREIWESGLSTSYLH
jgi:hypothetical protein